MMIYYIIIMTDDALIQAQDNILLFLMEGSKGRDDFWNNNTFKKNDTDERGIYPRKMLHMMQDAYILEKFYEKKRVRWRIAEGAFFRMQGKEYEWSYDIAKVDGKEARIYAYSNGKKSGWQITYISSDEPTFLFLDEKKKPIFTAPGFSGDTLVEVSIVNKPVSEEMKLVEEIEEDDYPYLNQAKEALKDRPKKDWLKKLKLWK